MKWPEIHRNLMFGNLHPMGEGHLAISLKTSFEGICMKCIEIHEIHVSQFLTSPKGLWGLGSNALNNANVKYNVSELS